MNRVTITITVDTSLTPGEAFHAVADAMNGQCFGQVIEGRAFFTDDPKGAEQADYAHSMAQCTGSVESTIVDGESVGFSGRRKCGKR